MSILDQIKTGDTVWGVHEHMYYIKGEASPRVEYVVTKETVKRFIQGSYREIMTSDGKTPSYYQAKHFGDVVFLTAKEAAEGAKIRTDRYDSIRGKRGAKPMRRTWEKYLNDEERSK